MTGKHQDSEDASKPEDSPPTREFADRPQRVLTKDNGSWIRFAGMGIELAGTTLLFTALGYWIDAWREAERPFVTAAAMFVGFALAMTRFIIVAVKSGPQAKP